MVQNKFSVNLAILVHVQTPKLLIAIFNFIVIVSIRSIWRCLPNISKKNNGRNPAAVSAKAYHFQSSVDFATIHSSIDPISFRSSKQFCWNLEQRNTVIHNIYVINHKHKILLGLLLQYAVCTNI